MRKETGANEVRTTGTTNINNERSYSMRSLNQAKDTSLPYNNTIKSKVYYRLLCLLSWSNCQMQSFRSGHPI